ncbi:ER lumen protein retaining receptor [Thozetella sp. PMI_491]|nr:ER lumen protein retaining receptor [Thozetella sp. PMI_491]
MAGAWNIFRVLADLSHISAKSILIFSIHRNRSSEGVSLITQVLYILVFFARYTDFFGETSAYNHFFKIYYFLSSFYTVGIMRWVYPRTREREIAWKMGAIVLLGSLALSPFAMMIFESEWGFLTWLWDFSQILESVCVLPQLLLLRQTTVPTVITSFYIVFLGAYRGLYVLSWILREVQSHTGNRLPNTVSVVFGLIQTALYADFAWVYWTRQRVKLRNGGVVDADDLRRGWLLSRIFGKHGMNVAEGDADDEESAPALGGANRSRGSRAKWGARGISVSADEGVLDNDDSLEEHGVTDAVDPDAKMQDPDELARAMDEEDDDGTLPGTSRTHANPRGEPSGIRNGDEWDED